MELKLDNTIAVFQQFADELVEAYKQKLIDVDAYTQNHHYLYDSVSSNPIDVNGTQLTVTINLAEYWKYIEDGREAYGDDWKSHRPPISAITNWISWKPAAVGTSSRSIDPYKAVTPSIPSEMSSTSDLGFAFAIATNIAKRGIPARPILKESVDATLVNFRKRIGEALVKDFGELMMGEVGKLWSGVELTKEGGEWTGQNVYDKLIL